MIEEYYTNPEIREQALEVNEQVKDLTRSKILGAYFAAQTAEDLAIESVGKKTVKAAWNQSWLSWIF